MKRTSIRLHTTLLVSLLVGSGDLLGLSGFWFASVLWELLRLPYLYSVSTSVFWELLRIPYLYSKSVLRILGAVPYSVSVSVFRILICGQWYPAHTQYELTTVLATDKIQVATLTPPPRGEIIHHTNNTGIRTVDHHQLSFSICLQIRKGETEFYDHRLRLRR